MKAAIPSSDLGGPTEPNYARSPLVLAVMVVLVAVLAVVDLVRLSAQPSVTTSASSLSGTVVSRVDRGLVDIDTNLGLNHASAAGTGMVITSAGEVITNNHVIEGATKITATDVGNGKTYAARVVGYDDSHDVAVLALEGASGLATVSLGNSASARVGAKVETIGNAGGTGGTPTAAGATIAALNQAITVGDDLDGSIEHLSGLIEIHGDLQPGDSGGPLVNSAGQVIGMDAAASMSFQFQSSAGEGFAIQINAARSIAEQIVAGHASATIHIGATAFIGVLVSSRDTQGRGALVEGVFVNSPAASAGLYRGDLITAMNGHAISSGSALTDALVPHHPGDRVKLTWLDYSGTTHTATIRLANGPAA